MHLLPSYLMIFLLLSIIFYLCIKFDRMDSEFIDLALIIRSPELDIPFDLKDEAFFFSVKPVLISLLKDNTSEVIHYGTAPDNTADGQDDLLLDGTFIRLICNEKYLGIDLDSEKDEYIAAFQRLIENYNPFWTTIIIERGFIKTETTIELLYRDVF